VKAAALLSPGRRRRRQTPTCGIIINNNNKTKPARMRFAYRERERRESERFFSQAFFGFVCFCHVHAAALRCFSHDLFVCPE
jgi:hypothetical protein